MLNNVFKVKITDEYFNGWSYLKFTAIICIKKSITYM